MSEQRKILDLLAEGKITAEQAEMLLQALGGDGGRAAGTKAWQEWSRRIPLQDLKQVGAQIASTVTQSLSEVKRTLEQQKRVVEQQLEHLSWNQPVVSVSHDLRLPEGVTEVCVETGHGSVQIAEGDGPAIAIHVRARVRTDNLADGKRALERALQTLHGDDRFELTVLPGFKDADSGAAVVSADVDVFLPRGVRRVLARTRSGRVLADSVQAGELRLETTRGSVLAIRCAADRLHLDSESGSISIHAMDAKTRSVYAQTKHGTIDIDGVPDGVTVTGTAHTSIGTVDIDAERFEVEFGETSRRNSARFRRQADAGESVLHIQLTARNGAIKVRG
ncbi:MAG: DUF4097 family beta strand repeat-containing protein [Alicyclobacillus macrosporangiidus]|uniref:SHOCT-like domain-containing protein n=1 Tax=Alicyclobacillus macrosporangiidus TaxID=392015 RepID=UPI0026EB86B1|nr:DUF4097 family beta strand repeat-containing protein [Alicyclobacillus macrosporangiidus]MCL6597565.1 DUF4097 family beta strand repeat-containing protein [Alicyclobacillus macrosporangiidus]